MLEVNTPSVRTGSYTFGVALPVGQRLRQLLAGAGISQSAAARICGYPHQSGIQRQLESRNSYFQPRVVDRMAKLIGKGSPPITEAQVQALAVPLQLSPENGSYPDSQVTDSSQAAVPSSGRTSSKGVVGMETEAIFRLMEDVALLKSQVKELKSQVARREGVKAPTSRPQRARRGA